MTLTRMNTVTRNRNYALTAGVFCALLLPACALDSDIIAEDQQEVCNANGLTLSASTGALGTNVTLTAAPPTCGGGENAEYQFWARDPNTLAWNILQAWSATDNVVWDSTGGNTGTWWFQAWVRDDATVVMLDSYDPAAFFLTAGAACTGATLTPTAGATVHSVDTASVAFTAGSTCSGTDNYRFMHLAPGGAWVEEQPYSATSTWSMTTAGQPAGWHNFQVWVRNSDSTNSFEQVAATSVRVETPCSAITTSFGLASPQAAGAQIAMTGNATCSGDAKYRFYSRAPGAQTWTIEQDYTTSDTFNWDTNGAAAGTWNFQLWVRNHGSLQSYESFTTFNYTIQ